MNGFTYTGAKWCFKTYYYKSWDRRGYRMSHVRTV